MVITSRTRNAVVRFRARGFNPIAPLFVNIRIITGMFEKFKNPLNITVLELFYYILFFHFSHLYDTKYDTT